MKDKPANGVLKKQEASPRYIAAHVLMPTLLQRVGLALVDAIRRNNVAAFNGVWSAVDLQFTPSLIFQAHGGCDVGAISFPTPSQVPEAYLGVFVVLPSKKIRYFTWERSIDPISGEPETVIGEWLEPGSHVNYGSGPPFTGDLAQDAPAVMQRVVAIAGR